MSKEIVTRLLLSKSKMLFESDHGSELGVLEDITDEEFERDIPEESTEELEVTPVEEELEDTPSLTESEKTYAPCVCGSTETVEEESAVVCADCGRELSALNELGEPLVPREEEVLKDSMSTEKSTALNVALNYWKQGQYQKAMSVCKKYGISDKEFAYGLIASLRESEDAEDDLLKESYFFVKYNYDGDELSDYETTVIVKASTEQEAIQIAKRNVKSSGAKFFDIDRNRNFGVRGKFDDLESYKKKFPHSNYPIFESSLDDELEVVSPEEPSNLDKNIIRAIQTQVSTANKPDLDAAIMEAFRTKESIKEALGADYPIKVEDLIKYGESLVKKYNLGDDKWAQETREEFCRDAHRSLARAWNNPKKDKSENFTGRMINARLSGDLAPWRSNAIKVNQNASLEWQTAVLKYLKQKFRVRESKEMSK